MKLSRKVLIYTTITTFTAGALIILYFVYLLPGLYIEYKSQRYLDNILTAHSNFQNETVCQPDLTDMFMLTSFNFSKSGYQIEICNQYFSNTLMIEDEVLRSTFDDIRLAINLDDVEKSQSAFEAIDFSLAKKRFESIASTSLIKSENFRINNQFSTDENTIENFRINQDGYTIMTHKVHDDTNQYVNTNVFNEKDDVYYITLASTMTPKLQELMPIILSSTPMIILFLLLFALVIAKAFSKMLATPIETLAQQAKFRDDSKDFVFSQKSKDKEFVILENALNNMHHDLIVMINSYQNQNKQLSIKKERQDIFVMNASHQLKTPIASASLLLEGMMAKVGPYKDTDLYLPVVQEEIIRMNTIVETMLMTYQKEIDPSGNELIHVYRVVKALIDKLSRHIKHKDLIIEISEDQTEIVSDPSLFATIIENILVNAIKYTDKGELIKIVIDAGEMSITNTGTKINEELIKHISVPFVKGNHQDDSTGIGLYLVDTFVTMLKMRWRIENTQEGVKVTLIYKEE